MPAAKKAKSKRKPKFTAKTADRHDLYERAVQSPEDDVKFLHRVYRKQTGQRAESLKEDFCGTALLCAEWVKSYKTCTAYGVDLDPDPLAWGTKRHIEPLGEKAKRVTLLQKNVLSVTRPQVDISVAFNFSYCVFRERAELLKYVKTAKKGVKDDGMFVMDIHGGPEAMEEVEEETEHNGFTYIWDQGPVDAISHRSTRKIHFEFRDGTRLKNAFTYEWRVWTLPEVIDILKEAGFTQVDVYWEGFDEDGEGNGIFRKVQKAENEESWIAYIVAWK